jgi:hypothetical protein
MELCKNCKGELTGAYCARCGQKKFSVANLSVKHFVTVALKDLTHFDSKLFSDLSRLLFRPGMLTREFVEGRINQHIKPTTIFLWMNVFFFLVGYKAVFPQAGFYDVNTYWPGLGTKIVERAAEKGIPLAQFIPMFNEHLAHCEKYLFFCLVPIFALSLFVLYFYVRGNYYVRHVVYSVHFWTYLFVFVTVFPFLLSLFNGSYRWIFGHYFFESYDGLVFRTVFLIGVVPYTWFALKRVYAEKVWLTIIKTMLVYFIVVYLRQWGIGLTYYLAYLTS